MNIDNIKAKKNKEKITILTAYSANTASLLEKCEIDMILVGDSLGMVFQGNKNTLSVTIDEMIYHSKAVRRGASDSFVVVDMPFMSYQTNSEEALRNAGSIMKEANANAVKMEGATDIVLESTKKIIDAGIPVMGHLGFTPQSVNQLAGYKVQGKEKETSEKILEDAKRLEQLGVFSIVLEMVPAVLAKEITEKINIPTISCGAGVDCDGQVLVIDDILGLYRKSPKFARQYLNLNSEIEQAVKKYILDVKQKAFPGKKESF